jgi:hypothetical protein
MGYARGAVVPDADDHVGDAGRARRRGGDAFAQGASFGCEGASGNTVTGVSGNGNNGTFKRDDRPDAHHRGARWLSQLAGGIVRVHPVDQIAAGLLQQNVARTRAIS